MMALRNITKDKLNLLSKSQNLPLKYNKINKLLKNLINSFHRRFKIKYNQIYKCKTKFNDQTFKKKFRRFKKRFYRFKKKFNRIRFLILKKRFHRFNKKFNRIKKKRFKTKIKH